MGGRFRGTGDGAVGAALPEGADAPGRRLPQGDTWQGSSAALAHAIGRAWRAAPLWKDRSSADPRARGSRTSILRCARETPRAPAAYARDEPPAATASAPSPRPGRAATAFAPAR